MKERSVEFYKKLILGTTFVTVVVLVLLIVTLVGRGLNLGTSQELGKEPNPDIEQVQTELEESAEPDEEEVVQTEAVVASGKMIYLTFDDGATKNTSEILQILKDNDVPATFFFKTTEEKNSYDEVIKQAYEEGHAIGILTSTESSYVEIFKSAERYKEDMETSYNKIKDLTGQAPDVVRFPGGSRSSYTRGIYDQMIQMVEAKGLTYFDWTLCADKGSATMSKESIVANGTKISEGSDAVVILLHDNGNDNTCEALGEIIDFYKQNGYTFGKLTSSVEQVTF